MANSFVNAKVDLTTTGNTTLYTTPSANVALVKSILVSNDDTSNACHVTVTLLNTSNTVSVSYTHLTLPTILRV